MPQAVTHILFGLIIFQLFRDYVIKNKQKFPLHYVLIGGLSGLLPDIDIGIYLLMNFLGFPLEWFHRTYTHSIFFAIPFFLLALIFWKFKNKELGEHHLKLKNIFICIGIGILLHILLDGLICGTVMPLYPLNNTSIGFNIVTDLVQVYMTHDTLGDNLSTVFFGSLDAALLVFWLLYLEFKHKISSFI